MTVSMPSRHSIRVTRFSVLWTRGARFARLSPSHELRSPWATIGAMLGTARMHSTRSRVQSSMPVNWYYLVRRPASADVLPAGPGC